MSNPRMSVEENNTATQLPPWQLKMINQIVSSMEINYIHFNKDGKTAEYWRNNLIDRFKLHFAEFQSEEALIIAYKNQFKERPGIYLYPKDVKIDQAFIEENIKDRFAVILSGTEKQRFIYCVINGSLAQDILWQGKSFNEMTIPDDISHISGKLSADHPGYTALLSNSLTHAAYTQFADRVTNILQAEELSNDKHLSLGYYPNFIDSLLPLFKAEGVFSKNTPLNMAVDTMMKSRLSDLGNDFGFSTSTEKRDSIPENVGYMKIKEVYNLLSPAMDVVKNHVFNIMKQFQDKEYIILDLRGCGGGTPQGVKYLAGFFFAKPTHLCTYKGKNPGGAPLEEQLWAEPLLSSDGKALLVDLSKKPLYVLIDNGTFSAAEELAYDLQQLGRAKLIGVQTKGGNHFTRNEPLLDKDSGIGCDTRFEILIPSCYSINPASHTNWEDGPIEKKEKPGVRPDIPTLESKDALNIAITLTKKNIDPPSPTKTGQSIFSSSAPKQEEGKDKTMTKPAFDSDPSQQKP